MQLEQNYLDDKLSQLKRLLEWGDYSTLYKECCSILEDVLKKVYVQTLSHAPYEKRNLLQKNEEEIGKSSKGFERFTLGELCGLYQRADLLALIESISQKDLGLLKAVNLSFVVKKRNDLVHNIDEATCSSNDAKLIYDYLINWLAYLGYSQLNEPGESATLPSPQVVNPIVSGNKRKNISIYSASYGNEQNRLFVQAGNTEKIDKDAIDLAIENLEKKDDLAVLDIGCASGVVTHLRFNKIETITKVLGVDFNEALIETANADYRDSKFHFASIDVESESFVQNIEALAAEQNIDKFDIIYSALTLHHLKDPIKVLKKVRTLLKPGGIILLRGSDDGSKLAYPDNGLVNNIISYTLKIEGVSDRLNGRKLYYQASRAGYRTIEMLYYNKDTTQLSYDDRLRLFEESFSYRKDYFKKRLDRDPSNQQYQAEYELMVEMLDELENLFGSDDFYYSEVSTVLVGQKK